MARRPRAGKAAGGNPRQPRKRDYHAEYTRRVARGKAAGKTLQQARGHKAQEHVERAKRERAKYEGQTKRQYDRIRAFAQKQAKRGGVDPAVVNKEMQAYAKRVGYDTFRRRFIDRVRADSKRHRKRYRVMRGGRRITLQPGEGGRPFGGGAGAGGRDYELEEIFGPPGGEEPPDFDFDDYGQYDDFPEFWLFYHD